MSKQRNPRPLIRVAFVQPIISPTRIPWFNELASYPDIELRVFSLRRTMAHRPGWETRKDENYHVEIVPSFFLKQKKSFVGAEGKDLAGRIIPIGLSTKLVKYNPHVAIVSNATELATILPVRLIRGTRIILTAEDTQHSFSNISRRNQLLKTFFYKRADAICAHSSQSIELLKTLGIRSEKISFTPWAVDNEHFYRMSLINQRSATRKSLGLNGTTIITVGALISRKGIKQLLESWSLIEPELRSNATLLIVGDGPERKKYTDLVNDKKLTEVKFTGHLTPDDVATHFGASDAFIFPTLEDVWGLVVNEAMATGLPVLCSCYAGCSKDLVHNGKNGYIFDPLDKQDMRNILTKALANPDMLKRMGIKSREIIGNFTVANSVATLVSVARDIART